MILKKSLRLLGYLNDIDVNRWEAVAVTTENSLPQFISGNWTVFGNVYFQNGAYGSEILNGTNITEVSSILAEKHLEMESMLEEKNVNENDSFDESLSIRNNEIFNETFLSGQSGRYM